MAISDDDEAQAVMRGLAGIVLCEICGRPLVARVRRPLMKCTNPRCWVCCTDNTGVPRGCKKDGDVYIAFGDDPQYGR